MKVPTVKINNVTPKASQIKPLKKQTPIKDALIVSGYCSLPIVFYEAACLVIKKMNQIFLNINDVLIPPKAKLFDIT